MVIFCIFMPHYSFWGGDGWGKLIGRERVFPGLLAFWGVFGLVVVSFSSLPRRNEAIEENVCCFVVLWVFLTFFFPVPIPSCGACSKTVALWCGGLVFPLDHKEGSLHIPQGFNLCRPTTLPLINITCFDAQEGETFKRSATGCFEGFKPAVHSA